jgi:hypothetical protein
VKRVGFSFMFPRLIYSTLPNALLHSRVALSHYVRIAVLELIPPNMDYIRFFTSNSFISVVGISRINPKPLYALPSPNIILKVIFVLPYTNIALRERILAGSQKERTTLSRDSFQNPNPSPEQFNSPNAF